MCLIRTPTTPRASGSPSKRAHQNRRGGEGWADVWRKDCFAWEYKGKRKDLDKAFDQLRQYAIALENPPLLIVSDMDVIRIHTNWTNTVQKTHSIALADLTDAANRDLLRHCFTDPERLKPAKTRQILTEEAAQRFATLAQRLRNRGHAPEAVAHFVNRLVFCMFAEDVNLLPKKLFERMILAAQPKPETFARRARDLFAAMKSGGAFGVDDVEWFNGGLFDSDDTLSLTWEDIHDLIRAARLDWADIDPSIFGTLFERGLDPDKRSQLGAHYTDRAKIMQIINPVIVQPLLAEWAEAKAQITGLIDNAPQETKEKLLRGADLAARTKALAQAEATYKAFLSRLRAFRVLDPACGSGNFLYLALLELKNIEHSTNLEAEALGLERAFPSIGPESVLGIELNPFAAELARVSVWIGDIQWTRRNGFEVDRKPILRALDTIQCRDAVLAPDGTRAEWPRADVVVGNPPFLGNKKMIAGLGETYTLALRKAWPQVPGGVDLVAYWFAKAWAQIQAGALTRAGLVATNSIRGGANREVLKPIVDGGRIFAAWGDEAWTVDGAAVRVSLVGFDQLKGGIVRLDGIEVAEIFADLEPTHHRGAEKLDSNAGSSFQGAVLVGPFDIPGEDARQMLLAPSNPNGRKNGDVVRPLRNGRDITTRHRDKWVIDFASLKEEAARFTKDRLNMRASLYFPLGRKIGAPNVQKCGGSMVKQVQGGGGQSPESGVLLRLRKLQSIGCSFGWTRQSNHTKPSSP